MKLPADKNERNKVLVLAGIGAVFVLYGLYVGVFAKLQARAGERRAEAADLASKIEGAERDIGRMRREAARYCETLESIMSVAVVSNAVLRAHHGNYLLGATDTIERMAEAQGLRVESVEEVGVSQLPAKQGKSDFYSFKPYTARVQLRCGLHGLVRLLAAIEAANPYLCVSGVQIAGVADKPHLHEVRFDVQWPVWADDETAKKLEQDWREGRRGGNAR